MAEILLDTQGTPAAPSAGKGIIYPDSVSKQLCLRNDTGRILTVGSGIRNWNVTDSVANAADTYLVGSALAIPQHLMQAGTLFQWQLDMTKTGAGTATPIWSVRVGTLGTTGDTARLTFTGPAQTANIDTGSVFIRALLRNTGAAGVMVGLLSLTHNLAITGFANIGSPTIQSTSSAFDTTVANLIVGISVNPGTLGVWTHQLVTGEVFNI
jgi:hypothetical protein